MSDWRSSNNYTPSYGGSMPANSNSEDYEIGTWDPTSVASKQNSATSLTSNNENKTHNQTAISSSTVSENTEPSQYLEDKHLDNRGAYEICSSGHYVTSARNYAPTKDQPSSHANTNWQGSDNRGSTLPEKPSSHPNNNWQESGDQRTFSSYDQTEKNNQPNFTTYHTRPTAAASANGYNPYQQYQLPPRLQQQGYAANTTTSAKDAEANYISNTAHEQQTTSQPYRYNQQPTISYNVFSNPLNDRDENYDDKRSEEEILITNMRETAKMSNKTDHGVRKPFSISLACLAQVTQDLQLAAQPFQSPDTLKKFKQMNLGLLESDDVNDASSDKPVTVKSENEADDDQIIDLVNSSNLSVDAKEFVPCERKVDYKQEVCNVAITLITDVVDNLINDPACFDKVVPQTVCTLQSYNPSQTVIAQLVDIIYDTCIHEPNFRYLGSQLCDTLARSETGLNMFRSTLLKKAQKEFQNLDLLLSGEESDVEHVRGFTLYMAELFLSLMIERPNNCVVRLSVLGRGVVDVVRKLLNLVTDANVQTIIRVLKLTVVSLEESLADNFKGYKDKLDNILDELCALKETVKDTKLSTKTLNMLDSFIKLRAINWGKAPTEEAFDNNPDVASKPGEYCFEPVFYTAEGKPYTVVDAMDKHFLEAEINNQSAEQLIPGTPFQSFSSDIPHEKSSMTYPSYSAYENPSPDPSQHEETSNEDYDEEFERFLNDV